jgi:hypothetical protein
MGWECLTEGEKLVQENNVERFYMTSAKSGLGIGELFHEMAKLHPQFRKDLRRQADMPTLSEAETKKKSCC